MDYITHVFGLLNSQTTLVYLLVCCVVLLLGVHIKESGKRNREEKQRKQKEREARKDEERINEVRRIAPLLFTGEEMDEVVVQHLFFEIMTWRRVVHDFLNDSFWFNFFIVCDETRSAPHRPHII